MASSDFYLSMSWLCALLLPVIAVPQQATYTVLPGCSGVRAVSGDGKTLLVTVRDHEITGVWTKEHGLVLLPIYKGYARCVGTVLSGDGSTVAGHYEGNGRIAVAFKWTRASGPSLLNPGKGWVALTHVNGISYDGKTIVGAGIPSNIKTQSPSLARPDAARPMEAYRWTASGLAEHLGFADPEFPYSSAESVSRDGNMVGGWGALDRGFPTDTGGLTFKRSAILWTGNAPALLDVGKSHRGRVQAFSPNASLYAVAEEKADNIWRDRRRFLELPSMRPRKIDGVLIGGFAIHSLHTDEPLVVADDGSLWTAKSGWVTRDKILALVGKTEEMGLYFTGYSEDLSVMVGGAWDKDNKQFAWMITFPKGTLQKLLAEAKPPTSPSSDRRR